MGHMVSIYALRSPKTAIVYIGATGKRVQRERQHLADLRSGHHFCKSLQNAANKHGTDSFYFEVLEVCEDGAAKDREDFWIAKLGKSHKVANVQESRIDAHRLSGCPPRPSKRKTRPTLTTEQAQWMNSFPRGPATEKQLAYRARINQDKKTPIRNLTTGETYESLGEACKKLGMSMGTGIKICDAGLAGRPGWPFRLIRLRDLQE